MKSNLLLISLLLFTTSAHNVFCGAAPTPRAKELFNALFNAKNMHGSSHFHCAAQGVNSFLPDMAIKGSPEVLDALFALSIGDDFNAKNNIGLTPLQLAIISHNENMTRRLIALGADVNEKSNLFFPGATPLILAAKFGTTNTLQILLDHGVNDIDYQSSEEDGTTALVCAAHRDNIKMVMLLLSHGANPNLPNFYGLTALQCASTLLNSEMVKHLLEYGATADTTDTYLQEALTIKNNKERSSYVASRESLLQRCIIS